MDNYLQNIIQIQNKILLEKIADYKFKNDNEKKNFIEKYNKINYHYFKTTKTNPIYNYKNKIKNINI